ncbi:MULTISPECIES: hypothetical protein [unclassified Streptomyces]|uniref:DUF7919 family protein n=1 Tax=unclassified Streptomyces TaxID=2593676 RepID=UPI0022518812|nr:MULTISPECIES: hypothetical protein [unclassified Streptomyces]MCX5337671.1 hypothetical protein [Streptomyces sp. NBC_00140]MCX5365378.1 hypothetical protein [Streptomyces sp. NBC_00124]
MFYEDLSAYEYVEDDTFEAEGTPHFWVSFRPTYERLAVGWLENGRPCTKGPVPVAFTEKLAAIQNVQRVNLCRGWHFCDLCPRPGEPARGNGEVRIPGGPGTVYAAPFLIGHYISAHAYRPPQVFIDAVMAVNLGEWAAAEVPFSRIPADADRI